MVSILRVSNARKEQVSGRIESSLKKDVSHNENDVKKVRLGKY